MGQHDRFPERTYDGGEYAANPDVSELLDAQSGASLARVVGIGSRAVNSGNEVFPRNVTEFPSTESLVPPLETLPNPEIAADIIELDTADQEPNSLRKYRVRTVTPEDPDYDNAIGVSQAHKLESYKTAGYVKESAADPENPTRMHEELDRVDTDTRIVVKIGEALDPNRAEELGEGSVRVETSPSGDVTKLAAYKDFEEAGVNPEILAGLKEQAKKDPESVKVIGALSMTDQALLHDLAHREELGVSYYIIGDLVKDALEREAQGHISEKWVITFADPAYQALVRSFGDIVLPQVGEKIKADQGKKSEHSHQTDLVPVLVEPCKLPDNIAAKIRELEALEASTLSVRVTSLHPIESRGSKAIGRLRKTLIEMTSRLDDKFISPEVRQACAPPTTELQAS